MAGRQFMKIAPGAACQAPPPPPLISQATPRPPGPALPKA
jgi:hypothetical protein